jgi:FkbM family methyltransferase
MNLAEFIYTTVLRPPLIQSLANKLILAILPTSVRVGNATVIINPHDPVVSGALTLGVYEKREISFMQRVCKPGQVMVDVGANVGLYTAIAGVALGPSGRIIALEPDPESFSFLEKTVSANRLTNTQIVKAAASCANGMTRLFTSSRNRGDNRLYQSEVADGCVEVETLRLDDYFEAHGVAAVDIIKIDVQGFEGHVIEGLEKTIRRSPQLQMLMEFWPLGLSSAGTNPVELLQRLDNLGLEMYEVKDRGDFIPVTDRNEFVSRFRGREYTNLVLLGPDSDLVP